ncbi:hypothetical protein [Brevundimonas sp. Root1423]|uniref:hypothetical protein n=1 Tax=Brevundimonas sp. Root1423 TaxID=1736462 RepID=UPI0006F27134|nr:hypothetical protein [Brevundimonas sp. Root1423]KQY75343.1 hypothetical protein ASD25_12470 [Brevundimonas sp. Root1423]
MAGDRRKLEQEALSLRAWAEELQLFHSVGGAVTRARFNIEGGAEMFSAEGAEALTKKPITAVGFNPHEGDDGAIVVYTARQLTKAEQEALASSYEGETSVTFEVAKPPVVDPAAAPPPALVPPGSQWSRYPCGRSISQANVREAGTLGCLVQDKEGVIHGLSANHVTGGCSNARVGSPISAPGIKDVGAGQPDPRAIGHHVQTGRFAAGDPSTVNFTDNTDAAIFRIIDPAQMSSWQGDHFDTPAQVADPREGARVRKVGRTTGMTTGFIQSQIAGPHPATFKAMVHHSAEEFVEYRATVYFQPAYALRGQTGPFAANGDSGALVVQEEDDGSWSAVGLVFSGNASEMTYMLPLKPILEAMALSLVSGHNPPSEDK